MVCLEENSSDYGEVKVFDTPAAAERHIETLLESGFESGSIKLLQGCEQEFIVTQRPVVSVLPADEAAAALVEEDRAPEVSRASDKRSSERELVAAGAGDQPYMRDGVRFSSLFGNR